MKSPLKIDEEIIKRYNLDVTAVDKLKQFNDFIWRDCEISNVAELVAFEKGYQEYNKQFNWCYDSELGEFSSLELLNGNMVMLANEAFQRISQNREEDNEYQKLKDANLNDLEAVVVKSFLDDISGLYRKDSYIHGIPPFISSLCEVLNSGLSKMPHYSKAVVRACNEYDKSEFKVGDRFTPNFCLTMSGDLTWENKSENRYRIQPLDEEQTQARAVFLIHGNRERQVTFLQNTVFIVTDICDWGTGKKQIEMREFIEKGTH